MKKSLFSLTIFATLIGSALVATPAHAMDHRGVDTVTYHESTDACVTGQALPCTTNAGHGSANVLRIVQHNHPSGLEFHGYQTTSLDPAYLWMAATLSADCKAGYDLSHASIESQYAYDQYQFNGLDEVTAWNGINISVPDANSMPAKKLALNIPVAQAFDPDHGFIHDFDTLDDVYDYGEQLIDQRVAGGMNEAHARSIPFTFNTWVVTHADVRCSGASRTFVKKMPRYLPLTIQFVAVPQAPAIGQANPGEGLTFEPSDTGRR